MDKMYYVYMLRCADGSLYTGVTTDVARRFREHKSGGRKAAKYTRVKKAESLEAVWSCSSRSSAQKLEYAVKQLDKAKKEAFILGNEPDFPEQGEYVRVPVLEILQKV